MPAQQVRLPMGGVTEQVIVTQVQRGYRQRAASLRPKHRVDPTRDLEDLALIRVNQVSEIAAVAGQGERNSVNRRLYRMFCQQTSSRSAKDIQASEASPWIHGDNSQDFSCQPCLLERMAA